MGLGDCGEMGANLRVIRCKPKLDCVLLLQLGEGEGELERRASFLLSTPHLHNPPNPPLSYNGHQMGNLKRRLSRDGSST